MRVEISKQEKYKHISGYTIGLLVFVIVIPVIIYSISKIKHSFFSTSILNSTTPRILITALLLLTGLVFTIWSNINLFRIGKGGPTDVFNIEISPRSKKLVITGPYKYTRNPMVFGINSIYFAIALIVNSLGSLIFCLSFLLIIIIYLKRTEEKRLFDDFGDDYLDYKKRTSMIIPFKNVWKLPFKRN